MNVIYRFPYKPINGDQLASEARAEGVPIVGSGPPEIGVSVAQEEIQIITSRELNPTELAALSVVVAAHTI